MPMYEYQCQTCRCIFESKRSFEAMLQPESEPCPDCGLQQVKKVILTAPGITDPVRMGRIKPDSGFKEVLQKIHEKSPGSTLKDTSSFL